MAVAEKSWTYQYYSTAVMMGSMLVGLLVWSHAINYGFLYGPLFALVLTSLGYALMFIPLPVLFVYTYTVAKAYEQMHGKGHYVKKWIPDAP